jgi:hypothetical protein
MADKKDNVIGDLVITPKGRLSYPHLSAKNDKGTYPSDKYEATLLIPKSADIAKLNAAVKGTAMKAFGNSLKKMSDLAFAPIRDGDEMEGDSCKNMWVLRAKSKNRPIIVGQNPEIALEDKEEVYGGAYARLAIKPCSYKQAGKPGVTWLLESVQILPGGARFGASGTSPAVAFATPVEDDGLGADDDIAF